MVLAPEVDDPIGDGRGGVHKVSGRVAPHLRPCIRIDSIDVVIHAPDDDPIGDGGVCSSPVDRVPHLRPGIRIDSIDVVILAPDDDPIGDGRRKTIERFRSRSSISNSFLYVALRA